MSHHRTISAKSALTVATLLLAGTAWAQSTPASVPAPAQRDCFWVTQWQGWKSPDPETIYLKVNMHDVYRVGLSGGSTMLQAPDVHLVSKVRGSNMICSPLDLDLTLADTHGDMREGLIVKSLVRMTPQEVAQIPDKFRP